ncbi:hypothetical protein R3W88_007059 [Solanum pinnatisectum]|uniref:Uncharacterized protein n=1 Tax=Solanum pinnatisectum TaxID=50273 RepID=A0AAV9KGX1_9SOLN|nr:hypothetical protein R3W88_007059 [Solanum pinnatisectum]
MAFLENLLLSHLHNFIHKDFHDVFEEMTLINKFLFLMVHFVDKLNFWHRLPVFLGLAYLGARRRLHQTADGKYNDPFNENAGSEFSFFGRNMMPVDQLNKVINNTSITFSLIKNQET